MGPNDKEEDIFNLDIARKACDFDCLDENFDEQEAIAKSFALINSLKESGQ